MNKEDRALKKKEYEVDSWIKSVCGSEAQQTTPFGKDRAFEMVPAESVVNAILQEHPEADRDFVTKRVEKAKGSYPRARVFEGSSLGLECGLG